MIDTTYLITRLIARLTAAPFNLLSLGAGEIREGSANFLQIMDISSEAIDADDYSGDATGEFLTTKRGEMTLVVIETLPAAADDGATQGWGKVEARKAALMDAVGASLGETMDNGDIDAYKIGEIVITPTEGDQNQNRFVFQFGLEYSVQR